MLSENPINIETHPYCHSGFQYALNVVSLKIDVCKFVIGACKRFINDYEESQEDFSKYIFDLDKAERFLRLVQKFEHVKGHWPTKEIIYDPWQNFIFMNLKGFYIRGTIFPRFRMAHLEFPRGQGKSAMASQTALFDLCLDDPKGNEISCFANKSDQARIVLDSSRAMARGCKKYIEKTGVEVLAHKVVHDASNSFIRAMSADDKGMDGLNDKLSICDELHVMSRELFEVITSGHSKRRDSLILCITTAGFSTDSLGYSQSFYAKKVCMGEVQDEQMFAIVYTIDDGDDIFDERIWRKANPGWGVSVDPVTFKAKADKAKITPADIPNFKVKHLGVWISEAKAYFDLTNWDSCYDAEITLESFYKEKIYAGNDLASKIDLCTNVYVRRKFIDGQPHYYVWDKTYIPEETAKEAKNTLYDDCIHKGFLISTPGSAIHYPRVEKDFLEDVSKMDLVASHFDPWSATQFAQRMIEKRLNMVEFRMNTSNLSEPTKMLNALIKEKRIHHNGNPLLRWCLSNVVCKEDAAENVFPRKSHEKLKIDLAIALIFAMAGWINEKQEESVYESRGLLIL